MPNITGPGLSFPAKWQSGGSSSGSPLGGLNEILVSELLGRYATLVKEGVVYSAFAIVTAPVIYTTAAGTGGPLLWNKPGSALDAHILAIGIGVTVVTTVAAALGFTGNGGQTSAPTSTTAIDASGNVQIGGPLSSLNVYRVGTPTNAGNIFVPFGHLHTGALTADTFGLGWFDVGGLIQVSPGNWASVAASATATTAACQIGMVWAELPT